MRFSLAWLKSHIQTDHSIDDICTALTSLGIEVESIDNQLDNGFIIATITKIDKHPQADALSLCTVDIGQETPVTVVCGAQNIYEGMTVPFAPIGVTIPKNGMMLKPCKIRGIESCGMLCSAAELMIGQNDDGIMDIKTDQKPGAPLSHVLDTIIDVSITPNRSDCFSVYGLARDLAAADIGALHKIDLRPSSLLKDPKGIETDKCSVFHTIRIESVNSATQSPESIQEHLRVAGISPQNFLIDITNYMALDLGHPMHVYDADNINGNLIVRMAQEGEAMLGLNDQTIKLQESDIVVADAQRPLALAGIMGGKESAVTQHTQNIILEAAVFDPVCIALSGQHHNITSESRTRFERGVDPLMAKHVIRKAALMIVEHCGGKIIESFGYNNAEPPLSFDFDASLFEKKTGMTMASSEASALLERLDITCKQVEGNILHITPPSFRHDITIAEDVIEEILRLKGYDKLAPQTLPPVFKPKVTVSHPDLLSRGFYEVQTWSFIRKDKAASFGDHLIEINNPISVDMNVMRPSLVPGLLEIAELNANKGQEFLSIFEKGTIYGACEERVLAGLRLRFLSERSWHSKRTKVDAFDIKADCLFTLGMDEQKMQLSRAVPSYYHPHQSGCFHQGKKILAYFGKLHPMIAKDTFVFEVFLDRLPPKAKKTIKPYSPYPFAQRDLSFVVDKDLPASQLVKAIESADSLVSNVSIFDVYTLDADQKTLGVQFFLQSQNKTLDEKEIKDATDKVLAAAKSKCSAVLR